MFSLEFQRVSEFRVELELELESHQPPGPGSFPLPVRRYPTPAPHPLSLSLRRARRRRAGARTNTLVLAHPPPPPFLADTMPPARASLKEPVDDESEVASTAFCRICLEPGTYPSLPRSRGRFPRLP